MEMHFQKTILATVLAFAGVAHAGAFTPPAAPAAPASCPNVTVPCERTGWVLGFDAQFLKPTGDDLFFASNADDPDDAPDFTSAQVHPDKYKFGFDLYGRYLFGTGKDVAVDWHHFDQHYSDTFTYVGAITGVETSVYTGTLNIKHDRVDFGLGQEVLAGADYKIRLEAGLQYQKLRHSLKVVEESVTVFDNPQIPSERESDTETYINKFSGIGPQFRVDFAWMPVANISLVGHARAGLVIGDVHAAYTQIDVFTNTPNNQQNINRSVTNTKTSSVIPTADMRLGLRYDYAMNGYGFGLEAGYRAEGVFHSVIHSNAINNPSFAGGRNFVSNYGEHGPYIGISVTA